MTEREPDLPAKKSVFGQVDQAEMIRRLVEAAPDETETAFFDEALAEPQPAATERLVAGIEALSGTTVAMPASSSVGAGPAILPAHPVEPLPPVPVHGRIADDPDAARAFIMFGPAGVTRST